MGSAVESPDQITTIADLLERLGGVPAERVRFRPTPGTATERDVVTADVKENRRCELVDGVLVEKAVGFYEARLATVLAHLLEVFVNQRDLGVVCGDGGTVRLRRGVVQIPDVLFISWERLPGRELPAEPIPELAPDLAVEVLSAANTEAEMRRKVREYFRAGTRLVWLIDPAARCARVYTSPTRSRLVRENQSLDGGSVLSGFSLKLADYFARAGRRRRR